MLPSPPPVRLALPAMPPPTARRGIPIVATIAPVALSVGVWAVTQSVLSLLFAGLGPVVAVAGFVDGRRAQRRDRRREAERLRSAFARLRGRVEEEHDRERRRLSLACAPRAPEALGRWAAEHWTREAGRDDPLAVRLGTGSSPSPVRIDDDGAHEVPAALEPVLDDLRAAAVTVTDAPVLADARTGIGIAGPPSLAVAVARAIALEAAAALPPGGYAVEAPGEEQDWMRALPHAVRPGTPGRLRVTDEAGRGVLVAWAREPDGLPPGCATILRLDDATRPIALSRPDALRRAEELARAAERHGLGAATRNLPERVLLAELLAEADADADAAPPAVAGPASPSTTASPHGTLAAPIGHDGAGPVVVDLVADGPHALVGGTTGSGKSELLVSWVLAMAHRRSPDEVTFLLIDFKGGAAFAPLADMPHVVGILSDLDARLTRRAIESLRAELLRRERLLASAGARSIDELPPGALARLVVVVDEFAAVVAGQPELHEVFGDLAARGRSLGLHLVLCTQRPAGVVRDGVLANVTLRIGLRMTDRGDSIALLGDDGASRLLARPRGRAVLAADGGTSTLQIAIAGASDVERARAAARGEPVRPWLDPLPEVLPRAALADATVEEIPFAVADLPAEQRQPAAVHRPQRDGHLLVLGGARSGRTSALAVLAAAPHARVLPAHPADAWQVIVALLDPTAVPDSAPPDLGARAAAAGPVLLVADDLDLLLGRVDPERRHEFGELLARLLREGPARRVHVVASALRLAGGLQPLAGLFGSRLILRMPSREEHVLAGGVGADFDPGLPPGAGRWRGVVVQVAWPGPGAMPAAAEPDLPVVRPAPGRRLAIVAVRPAGLLARLRDARIPVGVVGARAPGEPVADPEEPVVVVGDPDAWQADWNLLARVRRDIPMVLVGCSTGELRALTRLTDAPPPLGDRPGECWLVDEGLVRRARLALDA